MHAGRTIFVTVILGASSIFKWIKQYLRIKALYGTTENAVKTQI